MNVYFHVGLPRAASTFLQYNVFPFINGVQYVKKHHFDKRKKIIDSLQPEKVLFSSEMDIGKEGKYERLKKIAKEYPDAKIILVLRRHSSWIKSKYQYFIRKHGSLDFNEFFNFSNTGFFRIEHLEFRKKIELIENLFQNKPLVIFQEDVSKDSLHMAKLLAEFMGATIDIDRIKLKRVNKSFSEDQLRRLLYLNKKFKNWPENVFALNFLYRSLRNLLVRLVVMYSKINLPKSPYLSPLIHAEELQKIDDYYKSDWEYCKNYSEKYNSQTEED